MAAAASLPRLKCLEKWPKLFPGRFSHWMTRMLIKTSIWNDSIHISNWHSKSTLTKLVGFLTGFQFKLLTCQLKPNTFNAALALRQLHTFFPAHLSLPGLSSETCVISEPIVQYYISYYILISIWNIIVVIRFFIERMFGICPSDPCFLVATDPTFKLRLVSLVPYEGDDQFRIGVFFGLPQPATDKAWQLWQLSSKHFFCPRTFGCLRWFALKKTLSIRGATAWCARNCHASALFLRPKNQAYCPRSRQVLHL